MRDYPSHIANEFTEVFEFALDGTTFDMRSYLRLRDDFYQLIRSNLACEKENEVEAAERFEREPELDDDKLLCFAAANAEYYSRILELDPPQWCDNVPILTQEEQPCFPFPLLVDDLASLIEHTPPELRARGFIYGEHNFTIY